MVPHCLHSDVQMPRLGTNHPPPFSSSASFPVVPLFSSHKHMQPTSQLPTLQMRPPSSWAILQGFVYAQWTHLQYVLHLIFCAFLQSWVQCSAEAAWWHTGRNVSLRWGWGMGQKRKDPLEETDLEESNVLEIGWNSEQEIHISIVSLNDLGSLACSFIGSLSHSKFNQQVLTEHLLLCTRH